MSADLAGPTSAREVRPYGTWPSPLGLDALVAGVTTPNEVRVDGDDVWWSESRPAEGGRIELVRRRVDGSRADLLAGRTDPSGPAEGRAWNVRTGVLEYGGGAWCVESGLVLFSQWDDQRVYAVVADDPSAPPRPLTPEPAVARGWRYGDLVAWDHAWLLAVRETHPGVGDVPASASEPRHDIVAIPVDGTAAADPGAVRVLVQGADFVASPVPGPARLAWIEWDHPNLPWDGTRLCVARLGRDDAGAPMLRGEAEVVAGGRSVSVVQPSWDGSGALWCCSDEGGWWNLRRATEQGAGEGGFDTAAAREAEVGGPRWVGGLRDVAHLGDGRVLAAATAGGSTSLLLVTPAAPGRAEHVVEVPVEVGGSTVTVVGQVVAGPGPHQAVVVAASATSGPEPILLDLDPPADAPASDAGRGRRTLPPDTDAPAPGRASPTGDGGPLVSARPLRPSAPSPLPPEAISRPEAISFPSAGGRTAHALLYRPRSATFAGPAGERPPVVVMIHGGPTSAARPMLDLSRQLWTSRGFAVVDVDYGGSTGYGRPYRELLDGAWGIVDVEDCAAAVAHLAAEGIVDPARAVIRGGSAGGFTALLAVCTTRTFAGATSLYGVTDLAALARDTHKFESRYLDRLIGPWPEAEATYAARSPLSHLGELASPVLVLQGGDDAVVPPSQAEAVVAAAAEKGLPHAYVLFEGEGHGFRRADTIVTALGTELAFYGAILGFVPDGELPELPATVRPST